MFVDLNVKNSELLIKHSQIGCSEEAVHSKYVYRRVTVNEHELKHHFRKSAEVICIRCENLTPHIIKYKPNLIQLTSLKYIKKQLINLCKANNIFIEVCLETMKKDELLFYRLLQKLIYFRAWRVMVISTGATMDSELQSRNGIIEFLQTTTGMNRPKAAKVVDNSCKALQLALINAFFCNGTIASLQAHPEFEQLFLNFFQNRVECID